MTDLPPDPMSVARDRMTEIAGDQARGYAERRIRRIIKGYVPRVLHPLIPGEGGTVEGNLKREASRRVRNLIWSAVFSLIFFGLFGCAFLGIGSIVVYAVFQAM